MRGPAGLRRGLSGRQSGSVIGAVFGLVYGEANASEIVEPGSLVVRFAAGSAFLVCVVLLCRELHRDSAPRGESRLFGTGYWLVVATEGVVLLVGWYLLNGPLGRPDAALPWVTLVVGVHFFALALVFRTRAQHFLGTSLTGCGVVGLALAVGGAPVSSVALAAGICPGFVLLAFSLWDLSRARRAAGTGPGTRDATSDSRIDRPPMMGVSMATAAQVAGEGDTTTDPSRAEPVGAWPSNGDMETPHERL